jgi:hypothetical protein
MNSTPRQRSSIARSILVYTSICVISVVVAVAAVLAYDARQHEIAWGAAAQFTSGQSIFIPDAETGYRVRPDLRFQIRRHSVTTRTGEGRGPTGPALPHRTRSTSSRSAIRRPSATALRATRPIRATWRGRPISSASISASADLAAWARSWCCAASLILRRNSSSTVSGRTISTAMSDHASKAERPSAFPGRASPTARPVPPSGCQRIRSAR